MHDAQHAHGQGLLHEERRLHGLWFQQVCVRVRNNPCSASALMTRLRGRLACGHSRGGGQFGDRLVEETQKRWLYLCWGNCG